MNLFALSLSYVRRRALGTALNVLLLALGIATIVVLLLFSRQLERNLSENAEGIALVVGAKGSPLQLILSSIYHIDSPTGNIPVREAEAILRHPMVRGAIPLALGDSYNGHRIVGTEPAYLDLYEAAVAEGRLWEDELEVVVGAAVAEAEGLALGDAVVSAHGLAEGGMAHGERPMTVVGILGRTGRVADRLVLTSVETIWTVHDPHGDEADEAAEHGEEHAEEPEGAAPARPPMPGAMPGMAPGGAPGMPQPNEPQYTALLITELPLVARIGFPRFINSQTNLQAADPNQETQRLLRLLGVGLDALRAFGVILILAAALGVFIALYNALRERRYDLAVLRSLGASRGKLLAHVLLEGLLLATAGTLLGLVLGHAGAAVLVGAVEQAQGLALDPWAFVPGEVALAGLALGVGLVAALIPAIQAYRTDLATTLAAA